MVGNRPRSIGDSWAILMTIAQILNTKGGELHTVRPEDTIAVTVNLFNREKKPLVVVSDADSKIVGVVSITDVVRALERFGDRTLAVKVKDVMTPWVAMCHPHDEPEHVLELMNARNLRHVPVVEDGHVLGVVTTGDILKSMLDTLKMNVEQLQNYFLKVGGRY